MERQLKKKYKNLAQDSSLFYSCRNNVATISIEHNGMKHFIDLIVNGDKAIYDLSGNSFSSEELRELYSSSDELYADINNGILIEENSNWFSLYLDGKYTPETIIEVSEIEEWSDNDLIEFIEEHTK